MNIEKMKSIPSSRAELERHLFLLGETMRAGKLHIAQELSYTIEGLQRLRKLPNGRVDLLSLDEMTRLNANMMANMMASMPTKLSQSSVEEAPTSGTEGGDAKAENA